MAHTPRSTSTARSPTEPGHPDRMKDVWEEVGRWAARGDRIAIAMVVGAERSAPLPLGTKMASAIGARQPAAFRKAVSKEPWSTSPSASSTAGGPQLVHFGIDVMAMQLQLTAHPFGWRELSVQERSAPPPPSAPHGSCGSEMRLGSCRCTPRAHRWAQLRPNHRQPGS